MKYWGFIFTMIIAITACSDDEYRQSGSMRVNEGDLIKLNINLQVSDFDIQKTRALDEEHENGWKNVWVAQFDTDGSIITRTVEVYQEDNFGSIKAEARNNTKIYFITNVTSNPFLKPDAINQDDYYPDLESFKDAVYQISTESDIENDSVLVAIGVLPLEGVIEPGTGTILTSTFAVFAKKLTSKVSIIVNADQRMPYTTYQFKKIEIESVQICAVPKKSTFEAGNVITSAGDLMNLDKEDLTKNDLKSTDQLFVYEATPRYILENMQQPNAEADPTTAKDEEKNNLAPKTSDDKDLAAYAIIKARINDGKHDGFVDYKVYLGKNSNTNFEIERNFHYIITITITGIADYTVDTRIEENQLKGISALEIQRLNGTPATVRNSEVRPVVYDKTTWGDGPGPSNKNGVDHLKIYSNSSWGFTLSSNVEWPELSLAISLDDGATWLNKGRSAPNNDLPSGARIMLNLGKNEGAMIRTATIRFTHPIPGAIRENRQWVVNQYPGIVFKVPERAFFPAGGGKLAVPVRAASTDIKWRYDSHTNSTLGFLKIINQDGSEESTRNDEYVSGNGSIIFQVPANTVYTSQNKDSVFGYYKMPGVVEEYKFAIALEQLPTLQKVLDSKPADPINPTSTFLAYDYSTDPLFETIVACNRVDVPWAMDVINGDETDYLTNENHLTGALSTTDGKANTLAIVNSIDRVMGNYPSLQAEGVAANPIVTPAGICMSMNKNYESITSTSDPNFVWYLPARYHSLLDVVPGMLNLYRGGTGVNNSSWSSTTRNYYSDRPDYSAYFSGITVDVSAIHAHRSRVRCIRDRDDLSSQPADYHTYPYLTNIDNNPVVVTRETVGGVEKGYAFPVNNGSSVQYKVGYPRRYSTRVEETGVIIYNESGSGPIEPNPDYTKPDTKKTLSPKFQVAKKDILMRPNESREADKWTALWYVAAGWNSSISAPATVPTGCAAYREGGYDDWRLPTDIELRIIGLLGASGHANIPDLQHGGERFNNPVFNFDPMSGDYWAGLQYRPSTSRKLYVRISNEIRGSASPAGTSTYYRVRCVRDIRE